MSDPWEDRIVQFWLNVDMNDEAATLGAMRTLVDERPGDDPAALYEWASVHDALGRELEAIPLYEQAISFGLDEIRLPQAQIQLASSLRNVGKPLAAIEILESMEPSETTGHAREAFLALALWSAGEPNVALRVALIALGDTLPRYRASVERYAADLERARGEGS